MKRHLIQIPLNRINSEDEFLKYFHESTYNYKNKKGTIDFENKIIVLEDVDCMSDIILQRTKEKQDETELTDKGEFDLETLVTAVQTISADNNDKSKKCIFPAKQEKMTLSFILNLLDGLDEHHGRVLIITSNLYDSIDKALIRPGRVDLRVDMKNASINLIKSLYKRYYNKTLPLKVTEQLREEVISPAEISNFYITSKDHNEFISKLLYKCKIE